MASSSESSSSEQTQGSESWRKSSPITESPSGTATCLSSPEYPSLTDPGLLREKDYEQLQKWVAWEALPSQDRLRTTVVSKSVWKQDEKPESEHVEVQMAGLESNHLLLEKLFQRGITEDNNAFLLKIRERLDRVGLKLPTVEVRFEHLTLEAERAVGKRSLPTMTNEFINDIDSILSTFNLSIGTKGRSSVKILDDASGVLRPGRMTLLLGPPGSGRTSLLRALTASLADSVKQSGNITYNGHTFDEFNPIKTSAYVGQSDLHSAEYTVRETLDYAARYQGVGSRYDLLLELVQREKELGIHPDPDIDLYMKILGLEECSNTLIGDELNRGISGGQKKRVTIGEILVGPARVLLMDEITNGLDSFTALQIITCLSQLTHTLDMTIFITLLQPAPEIFRLFDDVILLSEGKIVYQGPRENVEEFFEDCGFKCPPRKNVADFLQEVISRKDQEQYWTDKGKPYQYVSVTTFRDAYKEFHVGVKLQEEMAIPFSKAQSHKAALVFQKRTQSQKDMFKITFQKEFLYLKRTSFIYAFRTFQVLFEGFVIASLFFRTEMGRNTGRDAAIFNGAVFSTALTVMFSGYPDVTLTVIRLPVFYKHREMQMMPAWTFALSTFATQIPASIILSTAFAGIVYYPVGFAPNAGRFLRTCLVYLAGHMMATNLFRFIAGFAQTIFVANSAGSITLTSVFVFGGYIIPRSRLKHWWIWAYWASPLSWNLTALNENEFLAPQWNSPKQSLPGSTGTLGKQFLHRAGYYPHGYWYWISLAVTIFEAFLFSGLFAIALTFFKAPGRSHTYTPLSDDSSTRRALEPNEFPQRSKETAKTSRSSRGFLRLISGRDSSLTEDRQGASSEPAIATSKDLGSDSAGIQSRRTSMSGSSDPGSEPSLPPELRAITHGMILPFRPLAMSFSNVSYFVDMPAEMRQHAGSEQKLQLLRNVSGAFRPGILTALVGATGAGKSTLMDVLLGRKTRGIIEGDIRISGFPQNHKTFARVAGYCEQTDVHSPRLTVHESITFSAWLRLPSEVDQKTKKQFADEVMALVELTGVRDAIVGLPPRFGLPIEQRKRLSIAVELVANPSIIFMDEPTTGLDARAAAIVMRTVRNTVDTGRTVVCTIHQPSIDIFESFDEILLLKQGGQTIYAGPLGRESRHLVKYFQDIPGIPHIDDGVNPAAWMLEVTSNDMERKLGVDFATIYKNSTLFQSNEALVKELGEPAQDTESLSFPSQFSQPFSQQFLSCLWKQKLTYWRTPEYNNIRFFYTFTLAILFGTIFWHVGQKRSSSANIQEVFGAVYSASLLTGILMATLVQPVIQIERLVSYRERAAGMFGPVPYALAQIVIEIPYTLVQTSVYCLITYAMINLEWKTDKFFLYFYYTFLYTILFCYYGMMCVGLTPNAQTSSVLSGFFFNFWNMFAGFVIPKPRMPVWWSWYYWINPFAWHVYGTIVSQFGDLNDKTVGDIGSNNRQSIPHYIRVNYGFRHSWLGYTIAMTALFPVLFAIIYIVATKSFNFQNR